jgi:hypothetical protein
MTHSSSGEPYGPFRSEPGPSSLSGHNKEAKRAG